MNFQTTTNQILKHMSYIKFRSLLLNLRSPKYFIFLILPLSIIIGKFLPNQSIFLNDVGLTLIQLISFPAIPLVLSAVVISINSIFSIEGKTQKEFNFARNLIFSILCFILSFSVVGLILAIYTSPGILSPEGKLSIGRFMLDVTDVKVSIDPPKVSESISQISFWKSLVPTNLIGDASNGQTLKVITGSILAGLGLSALPKETSKPMLAFLKSLNALSVRILDELLLFSPLILICLISGAISTISAEIIVALLNLTLCILLASIASLGIAKLVIRKFTNSSERENFKEKNPADSVFLLALSTGSSMACYPTIVKTLKNIGRSESESEASASLSLLIARLGNIVYNVIVIVFALNLYEVRLNPLIIFQVLIFGIFTGISAAGLNGVAVLPTIGFALAYFSVPLPPILILLIAIDPILTLARAAITGVLSLAISTVSTK